MLNIFYIFLAYATKNLSKQLSAIFVIILICLSSSYALAQNTMPFGRYCGYVFHNGYETKAELNLTKSENDHISGTIHYNDGGEITYGTINEIDNAASTLVERMMYWRDKYGTGFALLKFDQNFDAFSGHWGVTIQELKYPWTGQRCQDYTS